MARRRGCGCFREGTAAETAPVQVSAEEEMPMRRYTHTIPVAPVCCGTEQELQKLCQALIVQNDVIIEILSVIQELMEAKKGQEKGPGQ